MDSRRGGVAQYLIFAVGGASIGLSILLPILLVASANEGATSVVEALFPVYSCLRSRLQEWVGGRSQMGWWFPYLRGAVRASGALQWAVYGLCMAWALRSGRLWLGVSVILAAHVLLVVAAGVLGG